MPLDSRILRGTIVRGRLSFIALAFGQCNFIYDQSSELLLVDCSLLDKKILSFVRSEVMDSTRAPLISGRKEIRGIDS